AAEAGLIRDAVAAGLGSVMYDASAAPYHQNVAATAEVARWCHEHGVWVEAELGEIGGKDGVHAAGARTRPGEAARYAAATGVDALAVAGGSPHAVPPRHAGLDAGPVAGVHPAVALPPGLPGSSRRAPAGLAEAVAAGMTKINIGTQLNKAFTGAVRACLAADPALVDPRRYGAAAREAVAAEVTRLLGVLRAAG